MKPSYTMPSTRWRVERSTVRRQHAAWSAILLALFCGALFGQNSVRVDLATNWVPGVDFLEIVVQLETSRPPSTVRRVAYLGTDYSTGVRVANFVGVPDGRRDLVVTLLDHRARLFDVARLNADTFGGADRTLTVVLDRPSLSATQAVELIDDIDGDGEASPGDVVRYTAQLDGVADRYLEDSSRDLALLPWTVMATNGVVLEGDSSGDRRVIVDDIDDRFPTTIEWDAVVQPSIRTQATAYLGRMGTSPSLPVDATSLPMTCRRWNCQEQLDACALGLDECESALEDCRQENIGCEAAFRAVSDELRDLREQLFPITTDVDRDGVPQILDRCTPTAIGAPTDERGCSHSQFCSAIDPLGPFGAPACTEADWNADEPRGAPNDCRVVRNTCVAVSGR